VIIQKTKKFSQGNLKVQNMRLRHLNLLVMTFQIYYNFNLEIKINSNQIIIHR